MKKIVLFGAGNRAKKFLVKWHQKIDIYQIFDNFKEGYFYGYSIKKPYYNTDLFIIIVMDSIDKYLLIRRQLLDLGFIEFKDFIPYTIYRKKIAMVHGNCHMTLIKRYLETSHKLNDIYGFYPFPQIQDIPKDLEIDEILKHCDLFIHQEIRKNNFYNEKFASKLLIKELRKDCKVLAIPNLHALPKCFFPQLINAEVSKSLSKDFNDLIDPNIKEWLDRGITINQIEKMISEGGVYDKKYILYLWEEFCNKLLEREKKWDIKISDYIFSYYQREKLFTNLKHINTFLAKEIARRILNSLGCTDIQETIIQSMDQYETFIYADVKIALGLKFNENTVRNFSKVMCIENYGMDLKSYIEMQSQICSFEKWSYNGKE